MKRFLAILMLALLTLPVFAQQFDPAPVDKAVVYFVRANPLGAVINFNYYDGDLLIGRFNAGKYLRYECDPGNHVFWARSENRSFVEADLEAGKTYLIEIVPRLGGIKAGVGLVPFDPNAGKIPKRIRKLVTRRSPEVYPETLLADWEENSSGRTQNGLDRYGELREKNKNIPQLTKDMAIEMADLRWKKKGK